LISGRPPSLIGRDAWSPGTSGDDQALGELQAEAVDVGDEHHDAGEVLAAGHDAEFRYLLDGVGAAIGEACDPGLRRLGLRQERGEIGRIERVAGPLRR
jgi:hypothetical protein